MKLQILVQITSHRSLRLRVRINRFFVSLTNYTRYQTNQIVNHSYTDERG